MKVHAYDLKYFLGDLLRITEKEATKFLPVGIYTIYDTGEFGVKLYSNRKFYLLEEWDEEDEYFVISQSPEERINLLIEAQVSEITELINDGWTIKEEGDFLNLSPFMDKLNSYLKVKSLF